MCTRTPSPPLVRVRIHTSATPERTEIWELKHTHPVDGDSSYVVEARHTSGAVLIARSAWLTRQRRPHAVRGPLPYRVVPPVRYVDGAILHLHGAHGAPKASTLTTTILKPPRPVCSLVKGARTHCRSASSDVWATCYCRNHTEPAAVIGEARALVVAPLLLLLVPGPFASVLTAHLVAVRPLSRPLRSLLSAHAAEHLVCGHEPLVPFSHFVVTRMMTIGVFTCVVKGERIRPK
jgi:hypothetical protein